MDWVDAALVITLLVTVMVAVVVGGVLAARRPEFWGGVISAVVAQVMPRIVEFVVRRNPPEIELKMQECVRRGGEWDNFKKQCRPK